MRIKYLAHASFMITSEDNNLKIITDPYTPGQGLNYAPINETADIVTVSHEHGDHNNIKSVRGNPVIIKKAGVQTVKGIEIKGIPVYHDESKGSKRGNNLIFCFKTDGLNVCHLGDLGHALDQKQLAEIGPVDVLMIPVGGFFTIDVKTATSIASLTGAKVVIPMHYKTDKTEYPISPIDDFLKDKKEVQKQSSSEIEITKKNLPEKQKIIVLQPAL